jgi:hypothetical protein
MTTELYINKDGELCVNKFEIWAWLPYRVVGIGQMMDITYWIIEPKYIYTND